MKKIVFGLFQYILILIDVCKQTLLILITVNLLTSIDLGQDSIQRNKKEYILIEGSKEDPIFNFPHSVVDKKTPFNTILLRNKLIYFY